MPQYYFNIVNDDLTLDYEGAELADGEAAHAYAIAAARVLAGATVTSGHIGLSHRVEIMDAAHKFLGKVTFGEAVDIRP